MADTYPAIRVAAVQASSVFLDRDATVRKAATLIREAGANGAKIIGFPEGFIPGHPIWYHHHAATSRIANDLAVRLFKNSVEIPGPATDLLCRAAMDAGAYVVMGLCERLPGTLGTLFNSQITIAPTGTIIGKHQKMSPTVGERLVHAVGYGDTFGTCATDYGPISGLICSENANPLAAMALTAEATRFHVMGYPAYFGLAGGPMSDSVMLDARSFATTSGAFVIAACGAVDNDALSTIGASDDDRRIIDQPGYGGGSVIVDPDGRVLAGPLGPQEQILYAECDPELSIRRKLVLDFAGHYNRPDIFRLSLNRERPRLYQPSAATAVDDFEANTVGEEGPNAYAPGGSTRPT
jgi:aliphatic nitrilase